MLLRHLLSLSLVSASPNAAVARNSGSSQTAVMHTVATSTLAQPSSATITRERLGFEGCDLRRAADVKDEGGTD